MPRIYKSKSSRTYKKHDPKILKAAVEDVKNKILSLRKASQQYGINYSVIYRHLKMGADIRPHGGQTALSANEEEILVDRLRLCAEWGYPIDSLTLRMIVKEFLDRKGKTVSKFKNNLPGKDFVYSFLKRHKQVLSYRMCQNIKRNRAAVSHDIINEYFDRLQDELKDVPPQNIVNYDETNLCDDPGRKKIITRRGCKYPERLMNSTKAATSVMFSAAGDGFILPPYVVYKAVHMYNSWTEGGPKYARYNRTKSGWFDSFCFEDWVLTIAIPYLRKQTGKKILIGDNLASHLTVEVIRICSENDIHLVFLPGNSTHLTQPLDVAFFRPLKIAWRQILENWKTHSGKNEATVPKDKFPRLLKQLMNDIEKNGPNNVRAGFKKCGIIPLDREPVLKMLPKPPENESDNQIIDTSIVELLKSMRYEGAGVSTRKKRTKVDVIPGKSVTALETDSSETSDEVSLHDSDTDTDPPSDLNVSDSIEEEISTVTNQTIPAVTEQPKVLETETSPTSEIMPASYPLKIQKKDIQQGDWLVVNFPISKTKCAVPKNKSFIGQVTALTKKLNFEGQFYRRRGSSGFVYGLPDIPDITEFTYRQVVGKLNPPEDYRRGLKKFDISIV